MGSLLRQQDHFYCRVVVPLSIRATLRRTQFWKSLRTNSRDRAMLSAGQWERRVLRLFVLSCPPNVLAPIFLTHS